MAAVWQPGDPLHARPGSVLAPDETFTPRPILEVLDDEPPCVSGWCWCQDPPDRHSHIAGCYHWSPALAAETEKLGGALTCPYCNGLRVVAPDLTYPDAEQLVTCPECDGTGTADEED